MKFYHNKLALEVPEGVYYPREDSLLLADVLKKESLGRKRILEMGCGSGFLSIAMAKMGAAVTGVDISKDAADTAKTNAKDNGVSLTCLQSNLFSAVTGKFDLIAFNPPYLPEGADAKHLGGEKEHLIGGETGRETIERFVKDAKRYLKNDGRILLLISSLTGEREVLSLFRDNGFKTRIAGRQKVPWEELMVIEASKL